MSQLSVDIMMKQSSLINDLRLALGKKEQQLKIVLNLLESYREHHKEVTCPQIPCYDIIKAEKQYKKEMEKLNA